MVVNTCLNIKIFRSQDYLLEILIEKRTWGIWFFIFDESV